MNYAEVRIIGRTLRILLGGLLVVSLVPGNPGIITQPFGIFANLIGAIIFYVALTLLGHGLLTKVNPWLGAAIMDLPLLILLFPQVPNLLKFGLVLFFGLSLIVAGLFRYGGCEVTAIAGLILGKHYNLACIIFSPIDWLEYWLSRKTEP